MYKLFQLYNERRRIKLSEAIQPRRRWPLYIRPGSQNLQKMASYIIDPLYSTRQIHHFGLSFAPIG